MNTNNFIITAKEIIDSNGDVCFDGRTANLCYTCPLSSHNYKKFDIMRCVYYDNTKDRLSYLRSFITKYNKINKLKKFIK